MLSIVGHGWLPVRSSPSPTSYLTILEIFDIGALLLVGATLNINSVSGLVKITTFSFYRKQHITISPGTLLACEDRWQTVICIERSTRFVLLKTFRPMLLMQ